jgi:glycogen phosphorylase
MRAVREFTVVPALPSRLEALREIAHNLRWTWDRQSLLLFQRLDPAAWAASNRDPIKLLAAITAARWDQLAVDSAILADVDAAAARLHDAVNGPRWFQTSDDRNLRLVAYFSPEFGLSETLPQYSGGLGILAGDHLKAASDLGVPLVGVGLLYAEGYFRQRLNADGMQEERYPALDRNGLAIRPTGVQVGIELGGETVQLTAWEVKVGRITLYLLDAAVAGNSPEAQAVTNRLYGGDVEHRIRQEIVLGIGGVRVLRALGHQPDVFHINEGHAGFLGLERIRELVATGLTFAEAVETVRAGGVFTTHTPVPAGIDRFPRELMEKYFGTFAAGLGTTFDGLMRLGWRPDEADDPRFNMAVMGLRLAGRSNGVAALHGAVSRDMFAGMWPDVPAHEVPITSITNGVHAHTWVSDDIDALLSQGVGPMWDGADEASWRGVDTIADADVWAARRRGRSELVRYARERLGDTVLDPDVLTVGFARRFATYKRATLLLSQPDRLRALLLSADRPVQFVFAGKAHPADQPGKDMIRDIEVFARRLDIGHRFVFIPDYDMAVARTMYHGCDVWLNNPRRPLEACGTSGMKAALNGALNCSILDGWWDECFDPTDGGNGWAIASADDDPDLGRRDQREATSLFGLLEREIVPLFYRRTADDVGAEWVEAMRRNWRTLGPFVTASRMVRDYTTHLYRPAAASAAVATGNSNEVARQLAAWKQRVVVAWPGVKVGHVDTAVADANEGENRDVVAAVDLGALADADVAVEAMHGPIDSTGEFVGTPTVTPMRFEHDAYRCSYLVGEAGAYGITVRCRPHHHALVSPLELGLVTWAS